MILSTTNINGELPDEVFSQIKEKVKYFKNKQVCIDVDLFKNKRTLQQNKFLWTCFNIISDSTGYTKEEAKAMFSIDVGFYYTVTDIKTGEINKIPKETHKLNKTEFADLVEKLLQWSAERDIIILSPQEFYESNIHK